MLKVKLQETKEQLAYYESQQSAPRNETTPPLIDFDTHATSPNAGGGSNSDTDMVCCYYTDTLGTLLLVDTNTHTHTRMCAHTHKGVVHAFSNPVYTV